MKLFKISLLCLIVVTALFVIAVSGQESYTETNTSSDTTNSELSNADLNHLISILDDEASTQRAIEATTFVKTPTVIKKRIKIKKRISTTTSTTTPKTPPHYEYNATTISVLPEIERREDSSIETLKEIVPPSQHELVHQLSLLNSLLSSLGDNVTTTQSPRNEVVVTTSPASTEPTKTTQPTPINIPDQSLELLNSIFSGSPTPAQADVASSLLGLGTPSNVATRQTQPVGVDTEAAKALSEFLKQAAAIENQKGGENNMQSLDAASKQISGLLQLVGTLNAIAPLQEQASSKDIGQTAKRQNPLASLLEFQAQQGGQIPSSLTDLFSQQQQAASSSFDLGSLIGAQTGGGIGSGILSSIGSLGSSLFSTMSNVFSATGIGGKPRVRGMDTRLGLGYRFGDAADAQILWDVGPQLFTDSIKNEVRTELSKKIDTQNNFQSRMSAAANKRLVQSKQMITNIVKKPLSLLDIWNIGKEPKSTTAVEKHHLEIPDQLLMPPLLLSINEADKFQMERNKLFKKRSSASLKHYYSKPSDDPLAGHSTLTTYEKMLLAHGKDSEATNIEAPEPIRSRRPANRKRRPNNKPLPEIVEEKLPKPEYGFDNGLSESSPPIKKYRRKPAMRIHPSLKKRPNNARRRRPGKNDWKPRGNSKEQPEGEEEEEENMRHEHIYSSQEKKARQRTKGRRRPNSRERNQQEEERSKEKELFEQEISEDQHRPDTRPAPTRDDFSSKEEPNTNDPDARPIFNYNPYDDVPESNVHQEQDSQPHHTFNNNYEDDDSTNGPPEISYDDNSKYLSKQNYNNNNNRPQMDDDEYNNEYEQPKEQKKLSSHFKSRPRPLSKHHHHPNSVKDNNRRPYKPPSFSLSKIFHYWVKPRVGNRRRKVGKKPEPARKDKEDDLFERFSYKEPTLEGGRSKTTKSRFQIRNKRPHQRQSSFNRRISRGQVKGGIPYEYYHTHSPEDNPEANDSFLRRNKVAMESRLKELENQKLPSHPHQMGPSVQTPKSQSKSVLSFVRNYLSSKTPSRMSNKTVNSVSTLSKLSFLSNPSILNPLKILPGRRKQQQHFQNNNNVKTKLAIVNGQVKIINSTSKVITTSTTTEAPIIHVGEDMSLEDLTKVFEAVKNGGKSKKKKLKLKVKKTKPAIKRNDYDEMEDELEEAESIIPSKSSLKPNNVQQEEDEDEESDGLKGIFIDIESGEVDILKPVAELTSFEPKKDEESEEEVADEFEDQDGDGIADTEMKRKQELFSDIQKELKRNYDQMKKAHEKAEAKKKRKEELLAKGLDESMDMVSKYFDMVEEDEEDGDGGVATKVH